MNLAVFYGILTGVAFAASTVLARRALFQSKTPLGGVFISVPCGALFFLGLLLGTGQFERLWHVPWYVFAILGISGVTTSLAGRWLNYTSVQQIGANRSGALLRTSPIYAVFFGLIFLNESITILIIFGILLVLLGATLVSGGKREETTHIRVKGVAAALASALAYAVGAALVKAIINEVGSPVVAAFITFSSASIVLFGLFSRKELRSRPLQIKRHSLVIFVAAGILAALAQLFRFTGLSYGPLSLVEPVLVSSMALFVLVFSFLINRNIDVFTVRVILGIISTMAGIALMFL